MRFRPPSARVALFVPAVLVAVAACSAEFSIGGESPADAAVALIESDLAEQLGTELTAECDEPDDPEVGTEFACTATTPDGRVVDFVTLIDDDDHISVDSRNVILADQLGPLEAGAAEAVNAQVGSTLAATDVDCGDEAVVLDASAEVACVLADPQTGAVYDMTLTITDIDAGTFDIAIADEPRG